MRVEKKSLIEKLHDLQDKNKDQSYQGLVFLMSLFMEIKEGLSHYLLNNDNRRGWMI